MILGMTEPTPRPFDAIDTIDGIALFGPLDPAARESEEQKLFELYDVDRDLASRFTRIHNW
jgi:hypothetical protein